MDRLKKIIRAYHAGSIDIIEAEKQIRMMFMYGGITKEQMKEALINELGLADLERETQK